MQLTFFNVFEVTKIGTKYQKNLRNENIFNLICYNTSNCSSKNCTKEFLYKNPIKNYKMLLSNMKNTSQ